MRIEKDKRKVTIVCKDGSWLNGTVHINPGERIVDFLNDEKERFIVVTNAQFYNVGQMHSFKLYTKLSKSIKLIILNKTSVKWMEEAES